MSTAISVVSIILLLGLIISPLGMFKMYMKLYKKYNFIYYMVITLLVTFVLMLIFSWWSAASDEMLLSYYGYNYEGLNETERYASVKLENLDRVKNLETTLSGIAWPLKAIFTYAFYFLYLLIVYILTYILRKRKIAPNQ